MRPSQKYHPIKFSLLGLLIGGSALGSVWFVVKTKRLEKEKFEIIRQDSIQASIQSKEEVDGLYEKLLVNESRSKLLDTILNEASLSPSVKQHIMKELKDQNTILTTLRCDITKEDSAHIDNISGVDFIPEAPEPIGNLPKSDVASGFSAKWVRRGRIKSRKQIEIAFEYLTPHVSDTLPVFVLVKDSSGQLLDHFKKCFSLSDFDFEKVKNGNFGKKITFSAQLADIESSNKPDMVFVYHSRDGFIGCSKLR